MLYSEEKRLNINKKGSAFWHERQRYLNRNSKENLLNYNGQLEGMDKTFKMFYSVFKDDIKNKDEEFLEKYKLFLNEIYEEYGLMLDEVD